jgi:hypothetical protein
MNTYLQEEIWKDIPGYEGIYQASNLGRIKSLSKTVNISNGKKRNVLEKLFNLRTNNYGYNVVTMYLNGKMQSKRSNRVIALTFIPNPENKPYVNHINGIKNDDRVVNLEWCTAKENSIHAVKKGLLKNSSGIGEDHNYFKLTLDDVTEIRSLKKKGFTNKEIGIKFSISKDYVSKITNFKERISA